MDLARRHLLAAGLGTGLAMTAAGTRSHAGDGQRGIDTQSDELGTIVAPLINETDIDQAAILQAHLDAASAAGRGVILPAGTFVISTLRFPKFTRMAGTRGATKLIIPADGHGFSGELCQSLWLENLEISCAPRSASTPYKYALAAQQCDDVTIARLAISGGAPGGLLLDRSRGRVSDCDVSDCATTGIKAIDSRGLTLTGNRIERCGDNGLQVWRNTQGDDGTIVSNNHISTIRNASGGTGQYGNGINIFRAGGVVVTANVIRDCTYSAIRGNAADNMQVVSNSCSRLGEVAIYAEFGFTGAVIAANVIDGAATGIAVTNFNDGGRLATVNGNVVRNLFRRDHEPIDKRGVGISVEADTAVYGNTIENAPEAGIQIGWGRYMRDVAVTGNVIRETGSGIVITGDAPDSSCLIANNLISKATNGGVRTMRLGDIYGPERADTQTAASNIVTTGNLNH